MIKLGRLKIKNRLILAPMQNYSDYCLRKICYDYGCGYAISELIDTDEFVSGKIDAKKIDFYEKQGIGMQLLSCDAEKLRDAIEIVQARKSYPRLENINSIDLNIGCPIKHLFEQGKGAALLKRPDKVRELFKAMAKGSELPISAKIRLAVNSKHKKSKPYLRIAKIAEEEGLDYISVHGRTAGQGYEGEVDFEAIKEIREQTEIPIVGNGGIKDIESAENMLKYCDAIMIGTKAISDPFVFKQIEHYLEKNEKIKIDIDQEKKECMRKYLELAEEYDAGFQHVKIHMQGFLKGMKGKEDIIRKLTNTRNTEEIKSIMKQVI